MSKSGSSNIVKMNLKHCFLDTVFFGNIVRLKSEQNKLN